MITDDAEILMTPTQTHKAEAPKPSTPPLTKADFTSDQAVRWCPGCGDYSILANVQRVMPELGVPKEDVVFISGIGCSSRLPYYMDTYGFHTIHGRAPAFATGLKLMRPELSVWVITGDGDALSIGGNHLIHAIRRNLNVNILLFNNKIYGLTKGQYSPTSDIGSKTKTTVSGSLDMPLNPLKTVLAAEATFVARAIDTDAKGLQATLKAAHEHQGTSFVEIYQNCPIFNDNTFEHVTTRSSQAENRVNLIHGQPLIYGKEQDKGIRLNGMQLEAVKLGGDVTEKDLLHYDVQDSMLAYMLANTTYPQFPVPVGIFRQVERPCYEALVDEQVQESTNKRGKGDLQALLHSGTTWSV